MRLRPLSQFDEKAPTCTDAPSDVNKIRQHRADVPLNEGRAPIGSCANAELRDARMVECRHGELKPRWPSGRTGSSPVPGTTRAPGESLRPGGSRSVGSAGGRAARCRAPWRAGRSRERWLRSPSRRTPRRRSPRRRSRGWRRRRSVRTCGPHRPAVVLVQPLALRPCRGCGAVSGEEDPGPVVPPLRPRLRQGIADGPGSPPGATDGRRTAAHGLRDGSPRMGVVPARGSVVERWAPVWVKIEIFREKILPEH